jgi:glycosyltransferase involved in cell wall biosynthesis
MKPAMTDISVLTPSFGYGRFIADCIESVIRQEGLRLQHVIQDAGSNDETVEILQSFGDRVRWTSERDLGQSDGLNRALTKATGNWVGWLNADEYYLPGALQLLMREGENLGADVVYGDGIAVDREGRMLSLRPQHPFSPLILRSYGPFPDSVSLIIRRSMLDEDPWDPSLRVVMDWDLYLGLAAKGASFHYVPYPVGAFRQHDDQASARPGRPETGDVRERYAIPTGRWYGTLGTVLHRLRKLTAGSYDRQLRARRFHGSDLRWFDKGSGANTVRLLLDRCYGGSQDLWAARRE